MLLEGGAQRLVDVLHDPAEELCVDVLGQGAARVGHLLWGHGLHVGLRGGDQLAVAEPVHHLAVLHPQQPAEVVQVCVLGLEETRRRASGGSGG